MTQLVTLNATVAQIEADLRAGKSIEQISQDWSEPRANVFAIKRAMDAAESRPPAAVTTLPRPAPVPASADAGLLAMVAEGSKSKSARTRALAAKLDKLVEEISERLAAERRDEAEREKKRQEQAAARAEVERLEAALREARAKLGRNAAPGAPSRSKPGATGGPVTKPAYDGGPPPIGYPRVGASQRRRLSARRLVAASCRRRLSRSGR